MGRLFFGRPADRSPEAYRDYILATFKALTGRDDDDDPYTPEEWKQHAAEFWAQEKAEKGGPGSGNFGHAGRPGQIGGSASGRGGYSRGAAGSSGSSGGSVSGARMEADMNRELNEVRSHAANITPVTGQLNPNAAKAIARNAKAELSQYTNYLAGDTTSAMRDFIDHAEGIMRSRDLAGMDAGHLDNMMRDSVRKMIYQEIESNRQQFTDHGIRHIMGNIERQDTIYREAMGGQGSARERLMGMFLMVNHDIGYTVPSVRQGGLAGITASKKHPLFSDAILRDQKSQWNEGKIFTEKEYTRVRSIVRTHASPKIDPNDWLGTSSRLSDNLALFAKEKLPGMFEYVPGGANLLVAMGRAAKVNSVQRFEWHRDTLYAAIDKTKMSAQLKRDLKASVRELNYLTPKFTLGTLAGEISSIKRDSKGRVAIDIQHNEFDAMLQRHFNMGQRQVRELLKTYGHTSFRKSEYELGPHAVIRVHRTPKNKE